MNRSRRIFKGTVVAVLAAAAVLAMINNVYFDPAGGIAWRGALELTWDIPSENSDSTQLTDLAGYTIHCWNAETRQTETIVVEDPQITSYRLDHLWPGTYQCAVSAITANGNQSALSDVVTKAVR